MRNIKLIIAILLLGSCTPNNNDLDLYRIEKDGLYGFIDNQGKIIIQPQFDLALSFCENVAYARKDSVYGFINKNGSFIIKQTFPKKYIMETFLIRPNIEINGNFGNYPKIEDIRFSDGLSVFLDTTSNKYGYINKKGDFKIAPQFESAFPFSEGLAVVNLNGKFGYINTEGNIVIECIYDNAKSFNCNRAVCNFSKTENQEVDGKDVPFFSSNVVVIDKSGSIINAPQGMAVVHNFSQNIAVKLDLNKMLFSGKGFCFIDEGLNPKTDYLFEDAKDFSEDWAAVKINDKWGFVDVNFQKIIEPEFEDVQSFNDSLAPVKKDGKWGFINNQGNLVIENKYDTVTVFNKNLAYAIYNDNGFKIEGYIDDFGKMIWYKESH